MPLANIGAGLSLAVAAAVLFGATAVEAKPNPCSPIVDTPESDASVSNRFRIKVRPDLKQNCKVDEVRVEITEIVPGGRNRQAYYSASECCGFLSNQHHIIDRRVPEGTLKPRHPLLAQGAVHRPDPQLSSKHGQDPCRIRANGGHPGAHQDQRRPRQRL